MSQHEDFEHSETQSKSKGSDHLQVKIQNYANFLRTFWA